MTRFQRYCLPGLLLATVGAIGCALEPTAPTSQVTPLAPAAQGTTAARPSGKPVVLPAGIYEMAFLNRAREVVTTLPVGPLVSQLFVRVHVENSAHEAATDGTVAYEVCRWKGVSPTTGTRGGAAPSARCLDGSARWERFVSIGVNSSGDAYAGVDIVLVPCVMGWRATYSGSRTIAPGKMGPADMTWQ